MVIPFTENLSLILPDYLRHKYVIAVSGGLDSILLAELMSEVISKEQLVIAHFNHKTRSGESDVDAHFVESYARKRGVSFELGIREGSDLSENGLRKERRNFLEVVRDKHQCDYIVLAHHLQDQLETFLMRLLRGTGLDGLAAMEPKQGRWIRPLLGFSKESIGEEVKKRGVEHRIDSSNLLPLNFRNEIRLNLLPNMEILAERYGGKERWLQRLAPLFAEIQWTKKELNQKVRKKIKRSLTQTPYWTRISIEELASLSATELRKALRIIISQFGLEPLSLKELNRLVDSFKEGKKNCCVRGLEVGVSCGFVYFRKPQVKSAPIQLAYRQSNSTVWCEPLGMVLKTGFDLSGFEWRQLQPGDRFKGKKVKEYLLRKRIPKWERMLIPVLAKKQSNEIEWVYPENHPLIQIQELRFPFAVQIKSQDSGSFRE